VADNGNTITKRGKKRTNRNVRETEPLNRGECLKARDQLTGEGRSDKEQPVYLLEKLYHYLSQEGGHRKCNIPLLKKRGMV